MEVEQVDKFQKLLGKIGGCQMSANVVPTKKSNFDLWKDDLSHFEKIFGIEETKTEHQLNELEKNEGNLSKEKSTENSTKKCTFPIHIKCSDICSESNNNCLFVTNKFCWVLEESDEIIYYDRIPLNVPLAVVGEKLIRLNKFPYDNQILHTGDLKESKRFLASALFTKEENNFVLKDFSEIEKSYDEFLIDKEVSIYSPSENIVTKNKPIEKLADAVEDILLSIIQKDEQSKSICKLVNCFDFLIWTAIDKNANIIKDIQDSSVNIIEFKTEKCKSADTENHIRLVNFRNLNNFLRSLSLTEIGELSSLDNKKLHLLSVSKICSDNIRLNNIIDASKYFMNLHNIAENVITVPTTAIVKEEASENIHNTSQSSENLSENVRSPISASEKELASETQENIHNASQSCEDLAENVTLLTPVFEEEVASEKVHCTLQSSREPADKIVKSPTATIKEEEFSDNQEKCYSITQSSDEPARGDSSNNKIIDENDTALGKQDSGVDEKSPKKIKRKDGFGRNAKHISEMYPNADIEEEISFPNVFNKSSSSDGEGKAPEKKLEYKRKFRRRRPPPRTDNKHEYFRKDRKDSNNDKANIGRNNISEFSLFRRECSENRIGELEKTNLPRSDKENFGSIKEYNPDKKTNDSYSGQANCMGNNQDDSFEEQHPNISTCSYTDTHEERSQQNLKRNKDKSSASGESSESRFNLKRRSGTRNVIKKTLIGNYNPKHGPSYHYQPQQNFVQNRFQSPSVYLPSHQQWTSGMYTSQQWSEAYSHWYHMWYGQIRTISQYVEYSSYLSNMLQRK